MCICLWELCVHHVCVRTLKSQKRAWNLLKLEKVVVSHGVGAGAQTQTLCKSGKHSPTQSSLQPLLLTQFS